MNLEDLFAEDVHLRGPVCRMKVLLEQLPPADRKVIDAELANREGRYATSIRRVLVAAYPDLDIPPAGTIRRHRAGDCACQS